MCVLYVGADGEWQDRREELDAQSTCYSARYASDSATETNVHDHLPNHLPQVCQSVQGDLLLEERLVTARGDTPGVAYI